MAGEYIEFHNNAQPALNETNVNRMQQLIKQDIQGAVSGDTLPVGAIMPFGSDTIPENWLLCNGQAVSRTDYQQLFNTIGITFGQGDGFTTFNLPNLKGKVVVGKDENDTDFDVLGETNGEKTVKLIPQNYAYNSWQSASLDPDVGGSKVDKMISASDQATYGFHTRYGNENVNTDINNLQPYQVQNYIIKAKQSAGVVATVVDNLNSTSTTDALSANQGKVLNEKFNNTTSERVIGTWINGKPLYEKTITGQKVSGTDLTIQFATNVEDAFIVAGSLKALAENLIYNLDRYEDSSYWTRVQINKQLGTLTVKSADGNYTNGDIIAIIRYTKTTD